MKNLALTLSLAALLAMPAGVAAQIFNVGTPRTVATPQPVMQARLTPDGTQAVVTVADSPALYTVTLADGAMHKIADAGSLNGLQYTPDGSAAIYRRYSTDRNHRRHCEIRRAALRGGQDKRLIKPMRTMQGFAAATDGKAVALDGGRRKGSRAATPIVGIDRGQLCVTMPGAEPSIISPLGEAGESYMWPSLSPSGTRVLFYAAGRGAYTCDLDGGNVVALGMMRAPQWAGDDVVVGMVDTDDGVSITSSYLMAVTADGRLRQQLTDATALALYPTASPTLILYTTPAGELVALDVTRLTL